MQVFVKLETMFQAAVEQAKLGRDHLQEAIWIHAVGLQDSTGCSADLRCLADEEPAWSTLDYESWTLL